MAKSLGAPAQPVGAQPVRRRGGQRGPHMPGTALMQWRLGLGMTQGEMGQLLCANLNTISRWEQGDWPIPGQVSLLVHLLRLAPNRHRAEKFLAQHQDREES